MGRAGREPSHWWLAAKLSPRRPRVHFQAQPPSLPALLRMKPLRPPGAGLLQPEPGLDAHSACWPPPFSGRPPGMEGEGGWRHPGLRQQAGCCSPCPWVPSSAGTGSFWSTGAVCGACRERAESRGRRQVLLQPRRASFPLGRVSVRSNRSRPHFSLSLSPNVLSCHVIQTFAPDTALSKRWHPASDLPWEL